ncbi:MAG: DUF4861 family protein [Myxococcales bacterium]|nr:DUF4861 family protein [Myxococcales bacterium]
MRRPAALVLAVTLGGGCARTPPASTPATPGAPGTASSGSPGAVPGAVTSGQASNPVAAATPATGPADGVRVSVRNPAGEPRPHETISLAAGELAKAYPRIDLPASVVVDGADRPVLSQLVDSDGDDVADTLVFQADLAPGETKSFQVRPGKRRPAALGEYKVYGRFVRERHDDFAWENDVVAHRVYGPDLETWKKEPLTSSGVDTWAKRVPRLIVNEWYLTDNYHEDQGDGADFYSVGTSRGCGGLGVWSGNELHVSKNFVRSRVLANGPIRLEFELEYAPWEAGGFRIAETRRVTLDAGTHFNRFESTFTGARGDLKIAVGIAKHPGSTVEVDPKAGWMHTWEPLNDGKSGHLGCAVVLAPPATGEAHPTDANYLFVTTAPVTAAGKARLVYDVGSGWDHGTHEIASESAWTAEVKALAGRLAAPVQVTVAAGAPPRG